MSKDELENKLNIILTKRDIERLNFDKKKNRIDFCVDLHNYNTKNARRLVGNLINIDNNNKIRIKVIHGYNRGTAIRRSLYKYAAERADIMIIPIDGNKGVTYFYH